MKKATDAKAKSPKGKSLREKIRRHITDKNDVITEQDLREVIIGADATDLSEPEEPTFLAKDIPPARSLNPWDIMDTNK